MDPDAAYDAMTDHLCDRTERAEAAEALIAWIRLGGYLPTAPYSTAPGSYRAAAIMAEAQATSAEMRQCIVVPGSDGPTLWDCACPDCDALQVAAP